MPDLAVMFAFSLQPPQCNFSKGSGLQCTCKQLQCETQPCLFLHQIHPSVSWTLIQWKNRTEGNLNIYTKALTWSVPPICSSLFAATNTTSSLFFVSGMFVYLKVLLLLSFSFSFSLLIIGRLALWSLDAPVCLNQYLGTNTEHEYECVWMCVWNMLYKVLL